LKPAGTERLKLDYDALLSSVAFKYSLRRYNLAALLAVEAAAETAGAYHRSLSLFSAQLQHF
jgi:hypothetical protein